MLGVTLASSPPGGCLKLEAWRKAHPGQPEPDDATMIAWLASLAYDELMHEWELAYAAQELEMMEERGETQLGPGGFSYYSITDLVLLPSVAKATN